MITLITPTADRPAAWPHLERWIARQTVPYAQWIVVDDGVNPAPLTMGQEHIRRKRSETGGASLAMNILAAIPHVRGEQVVIVEDDDYYRATHLQVCAGGLRQHRATGCRWLNYYNLNIRSWMRIKNACAALCNTALHVSLLPHLQQAALQALEQNIYHIDRLFWQRVGTAGLHDVETVIGIKGLPGTPGIGIGHQPDRAGWQPDLRGRKLRHWLGDDAAFYNAQI